MKTGIVPQFSNAVRQLIDIGLIPENCTRFELIIDAKDAIRAKCEFVVTEEQLGQIATAFKDSPDEAREIIRTIDVGVGYSVGHPQFERIPNLRFDV